MELTDNDRQRIEQEADTKAHAYNSSMMNIEWKAYYKGYRTGAEYATIYEREQQAITEQNYVSAVKGRMDFRDAFRKQRNQIQELEAERSELRNKVIEWISVDDNMPANNEDVLAYARDWRNMRQTSYSIGSDQDAEWFKRNYSHWAKLPDSPLNSLKNK